MSDLVKLQHERDRGPGEFVLVNGTKYELDAEGNIEVPEADAAKLQLGAKWRPPEHWDARRDKIASATPPPSPVGGGRRVRSRAELMAMAEVNGIPVEEVDEKGEAISEKDPEAKEADAKAAAKADAELAGQDTIEVSEDMTKSELLALGADVGLQLNKGMSKAQILEAFENAE